VTGPLDHLSSAPEFTLPFWEAIADGRLLVPECPVCSRRFFTPEPLCPHCGSAGWRWAQSPGVGSVYSVSVVHQPVNQDHEVPFALAIADLDDGWTMLTHVVGCAPDAVRIGMRIRFDPDTARARMLPVFRPAGPAPVAAPAGR
jgi:uncharacterized OB-fold protein